MDFLQDARFKGIEPFKKKVWLASPSMHGDEQHWVSEAFRTNWVSTFGENIDEVERQIAEYVGCKYAVGLSCGTDALHLATKLAGEKLYGQPPAVRGTLHGHKVFCSDLTFAATLNPVAYENGEAVFIDTEYDTWNMDPVALERAFELYPDVKLVVVAHLYGTPGKIEELKAVCDKHGALMVEDAAESLGAKYKYRGEWIETGTFGDYNAISFNGNKIITGSCGGMFLTDSKEDADKVRKWSTQSRDDAPWYQHTEIGHNYRMSNIIAGVIRGQIAHLDEHIEQKRAIWERYEKGLAGLPLKMNPWDREKSIPNFWLSAFIIDEEAMAPATRGDMDYSYEIVPGKSSPQEIFDVLTAFNVQCRPIWKPMHMQPIYSEHAFVAAEDGQDVSADIFRRGLCLPSDNKMALEEQDVLMDIIHRCFY